MAGQSAVLLKNKGILPLGDKVKSIAVIGPMADAPYDQLGTWIFDAEKARTVTPVKALRDMYGDKVRISFEPGTAYSRDRSKDGFAKALSVARSSDIIIAIVGEEAILSGEAHSLADISLKGSQKELIAELKKTGKPLVTVVMAGRPLTIKDELDVSDALIYYFHPGTMGGPALADLLSGKIVPSGKLPMTFPKMVGQIPLYYNHNNTGRPANKTETLIDDIPLEAGQTSLGNTSYYLDAGFDPLFPFGFGLSYTTFEYSNLRLSNENIRKGEDLTVTVTLKNTGKYDATEVAQLYIRDLVGSIVRPVKELKGFQRVRLAAGEAKDITFTVTTDDLAFYGAEKKRVAEPGEFKLWVGTDSNADLEAGFKFKAP
jgi:beta-glucosidase